MKMMFIDARQGMRYFHIVKIQKSAMEEEGNV